MNSVNIKIKNTIQLYSHIKKYILEIPKFNKNNFTVDIINTMEIIETIFPKINIIAKDEKILNIHDIFKLWSLINEVLYHIKIILTILQTIGIRYQKKFVNDVTDIDINKINNLYGNMLLQYKKYKKNTIQIDTDNINHLTDAAQQILKWNKENAIDNADTLTEIVKKYPFSISLYSFIIQKSINTCLSFGNEICNYILNQVELVKDIIMLYDKKIQSGKKEIYKINPNLQTFGLTPHSESDTLKNITKKLFNESIDSVSKLENLAKKEKTCIIIMNHIIKKPIEFDIWKLIDRDLAKQYVQSADMGITQKTIDRFKNIDFKSIGKGKKWNFNIQYYGNIDSEYFTILENISYNLYRIFSIYDEMPIIGGGKIYTKIHKSNIPEFIEYVNNKGVLKNNSRIQEYNNIQEKIILDNMFLPIKFDIHSIKLDSQIIDSKFLRHELFTQIINQLNIIVKKDFANGSKIKAYKDIGEIIHDDRIIDIFNSIVIEHYDAYAIKNNVHNSNFPVSETIQTFLSVIFDMNTEFRRILHDYYIKTEIDPKIFDINIEAKCLELQIIFKEIVDMVLKKIVSNELNIYQQLIYKNSLLKLSLF